MLTSRLMALIESNATSLIRDAMQDIVTNERTSSFRRVPVAELELRVAVKCPRLLYQSRCESPS